MSGMINAESAKMQKMPRASISFKKLKMSTLMQTLRHNAREHDTASQVHADFRFAAKNPTIDAEKFGIGGNAAIEKAKSLVKRKDNTVAFCFSMQVGDYEFWREKNGTVKKPQPLEYQKLFAAAFSTIAKRFGRENIARIDLHLDETTPHFQIIAVPVKNNKLQSKEFVGGKSLAEAIKNVNDLREEFLRNVEHFCEIKINREKVVRPGDKPLNHENDNILKKPRTFVKSFQAQEESDRVLRLD